VTYPTIAIIEALFVKTRVNLGIANRRKYDMCSANGWMTAAPTQYYGYQIRYKHIISAQQ